jgi:hypothetical protein
MSFSQRLLMVRTVTPELGNRAAVVRAEKLETVAVTAFERVDQASQPAAAYLTAAVPPIEIAS